MGPPEIAKLSFVGDIHGLVGKKNEGLDNPTSQLLPTIRKSG
jgi:hypothetical protein